MVILLQRFEGFFKGLITHISIYLLGLDA